MLPTQEVVFKYRTGNNYSHIVTLHVVRNGDKMTFYLPNRFHCLAAPFCKTCYVKWDTIISRENQTTNIKLIDKYVLTTNVIKILLRRLLAIFLKFD